MSSTFTNLGLAALLSTTAFAALLPRQAPSDPTTCFDIEAMAEGQVGQFVYIVPHPGQNYTTGLQATIDDSTLFTLTDVINSAGTLFACERARRPSQERSSPPNRPGFSSNFLVLCADAAAGSAVATKLRCEAEADTNYLRCAGIEQFNVCTGSIYGAQGDEVPSGCELVDLMIVEAECLAPSSAPSTSSMPLNSTMSSISMISTATPSFSNTNFTYASSSMMPTGTLTPLVPTAPVTIDTGTSLAAPTLHPASSAGPR